MDLKHLAIRVFLHGVSELVFILLSLITGSLAPTQLHYVVHLLKMQISTCKSVLFGRWLSCLSTSRWCSLICVHFPLGGKPLFASAFSLWVCLLSSPSLPFFFSLLKRAIIECMSQIFIGHDYSYFQVKVCCMDYKWWWMKWKCINFIWPFTNGGSQYLYSGWCYNKLVIRMKTSEIIIPTFKVLIHAYILLWNQGRIFNLLYKVILKKKKKKRCEIKLQLRDNP